MSGRRKVTVVGAGNVGATCAQVLARHDYADVVVVDIKENLPQGKALDIDQMVAVLGYEPRIVGSNGYDETAGSGSHPGRTSARTPRSSSPRTAPRRSTRARTR
jgi:malate dehydrogenase